LFLLLSPVVSDDGKIHIWSTGYDKPERVLTGHQSDIKTVDWHPYRSLIASGSRDATVKLWDPKTSSNSSICTITSHKKQINTLQWNTLNGNWLATGSTDGLIKVFDIRVMKEFETFRGGHNNADICRLAWNPMHESLLVSGGYNGSLAYWIVGQYQSAHTRIDDAHRQSIDLITWHPSGHLLATASHDCMLKFWCREPIGSKLEPPPNESLSENPPNYLFGPLIPQAIENPHLLDSKPDVPVVSNVKQMNAPSSSNTGGGGHYGPGGGGSSNRKRPLHD
jgi:WD40 repeat protein